MGYFYAYLLVFLQSINILKGELHIEISANVNGTEIPIFESTQQHAGTNLTLICKLVNLDMDLSSHFDDKLSWGKKRFNNDLENHASNKRKELNYSKNEINQAILSLRPLLAHNSGIYFCTSLKYHLFKIIKLHVSIDPQTESEFNFRLKNRRSLRKYDCAEENMFTCTTETACIDSLFICDNVKDCSDGSDENVALCGDDPCVGKKQCSTGRCISESLCCDETQNCTVNIEHPCCIEDKTNDISNFNRAAIDSSQKSGKKTLTYFQIMWIVVMCAIVLVFATMCIVLIQSRSKFANGSSVTRNAAPAHNSGKKRRHNAFNTTSFTYNPSGNV